MVLVLALGGGMNLVMFQLLDQLLFQPPVHVREPEELARAGVVRYSTGGVFRSATLSYPAFEALRADTVTFASAAAYMTTGVPSVLPTGGHLRVSLVTTDYFHTLGVAPELGRLFGSEYGDRPGDPVAVIAHHIWSGTFGRSRQVIGRGVRLGGQEFTIVGVLPAGFSGVDRERVDVWLPLASAAGELVGSDWRYNHASAFLRTIVRLRQNVDRSTAETRATIHYRAALEAAGLTGSAIVELEGIATRSVRDRARLLQIAGLVGGLSLLMVTAACANVANVLLARSMAREPEIVTRVALGAAPEDIARLVFTEAAVIGASGSLVAAAAALAGHGVVRAWLLPDLTWGLPLAGERFLVAVLVLLMLTVLGIGLIPAIASQTLTLGSRMRALSPSATLRFGGRRSALVVVQVAVLVVLLGGAGTFYRTFRNLKNMDVGFDAQKVVVVDFDVSGLAAPDVLRLYDAAVEKVRRIPGVSRVALATAIPFRRSHATYLRVSGADSVPHLSTGGPYVVGADPDYFRTVGAKILAGGTFPVGAAGEAPVTMVNETMARRVWGRLNVVGECVWIANEEACRRIVGVVQDQKREMLMESETMQLYVPLRHAPAFLTERALYARGAISGSALVAPLRHALSQLGRSAPYARIDVLAELMEPELRAWKLAMVTAAAYAVLALLVGLTGVYSVIAVSLAQRKRDLALRLAVGAPPLEVGRVLLNPVLRSAGVGIGIGLALILVGWRNTRVLVVGVSLQQALGFAAVSVAVVVIAAALAAGYLAWDVLRRNLTTILQPG